MADQGIDGIHVPPPAVSINSIYTKKPTKMNYQEFENKVKSMTAHDIIMSMVEGLRQPRAKIDMGTFGEINSGICYGGAATNAILHIMDFDKYKARDYVHASAHYRTLIRTSSIYDRMIPILYLFEGAIDWLGKGRVDLYNRYAMNGGFAPITLMPGQKLPRLGNDYTEAQLQQYEKLAKYQLTV